VKVILNVNEKVKVKVTNAGIQFLKEKHDKINQSYKEQGSKGLPFNLVLDENGYMEVRLEDMMRLFGDADTFLNRHYDPDILIGQ